MGRESDLQNLHEQLQQNTTVSIAAISEMGGIGKTELALQYSLNNLETYPGGICWLKAREDVATQVVLFSRIQNRTPPEDLELAAQVRWCWSHWPEKPTLIVFDDVQDLNGIQSVLPPTTAQFKVLLTSRTRFGSPIYQHEIRVLSEAAALDLLKSLVQDNRIAQDLGTANQICQWLGYLPLGLELVGRYLSRKPDLSIAQVWQRLKNKSIDSRALKKDRNSLMTAKLEVKAAFELSWQALSEPAQQLAAILSLFALADIPWNLVEAFFPKVDPEVLEDLRDEELIGLSLLTSTGQGLYELHPLLREFFVLQREQLYTARTFKQTFCKIMVQIAKQIPPTPTLSIIQEVNTAIPHLQEATTTLALWLTDEDLTWPAVGIARFYEGQSAFTLAEYWYKYNYQMTENRLGTDHPAVATSLNNLGLLYYTQGRYSDAEPLYLRSIQIREQQLVAEHLDVAQSLNNLAVLYKSQGRYSDAEALHLRSLQIRKQQLGVDHPDVATSLNNLALIYQLQGRYSDAELLHLRSREIWEQQLGVDHPNVATSLNNLALIYQLQGRYSDAEPLYVRSLTIIEHYLGADHPNVAQSLSNLATLYELQGRYSDAEPLHLRSLQIREQHLGADHPDVAISLNNLAGLYDSQGRYSDAEPLYLRSLQIREQQLGTEHPDVATSLNNLANLYYAQGRYSEAEPLYLRSQQIWEQQLGADHPSVATSLNNLVMLYKSMIDDYKFQGRYDLATEYQEKMINLRLKLLAKP